MKIKFLFFLAAFAIVFSSSCSKDDTPEKTYMLGTPTVTDPGDYEVYSAAINAVLTNVSDFHIEQSTAKLNSLAKSDAPAKEKIITEIPSIDVKVFADILIKSEKTYLLDSKMNIPLKKYSLLSEEEKKDLFKGPSRWDNYYNKYSKSSGILSLSIIGYNDSKDQAILELSMYNNILAAEGFVAYLKKENGIWIVKKVLMTWVS